MDRGAMTNKTHINENPHFQGGFTLIEVMIALVVLLMGMLGTMAMQYYAVGGNAFSREMRIATNFSQQQLEHIKSTPYANLVTFADAPQIGNAISGNIQFARAWWVVPDCVSLSLVNDNNSCAGLAAVCTSDPDPAVVVQSSAVRIRSCWTDKNGVVHSTTLDTIRWNENVIP
jgi:prepilin-type N-terminal cleavage/methylation domain-containing protein